MKDLLKLINKQIFYWRIKKFKIKNSKNKKKLYMN